MKIVLPYVTTPDENVKKMVEIANVKKGQKSVDLGAGDGRVVIAMAKAGAQAYGYEIVKKYARRAKTNVVKENLQDKAFIFQSDFWTIDLSIFSIVTFYGMKMLMDDIGVKLTKELRPGTRVISNGFKIPNWQEEKADDHLYFYIKE